MVWFGVCVARGGGVGMNQHCMIVVACKRRGFVRLLGWDWRKHKEGESGAQDVPYLPFPIVFHLTDCTAPCLALQHLSFPYRTIP